jgi:hypothetical protein
MGRGHNPDISPKERLKWLEKLEEGQGITSVSEEAGRDIRIVKRNIEIAREERQTARVRQDFLLGKLEQHQQDLLDEVRRLKAQVTLFPPHSLVPDESLQKKIHEAFLEHINRLLLKGLFKTWETAYQEFEQERVALKSALSRYEAEIKSALPKEIQTLEWSSSLLEALEQGSAPDGSTLMKLKHYEHPRVESRYHPFWGATRLTQDSLDSTRASLVIKAHKQLVEYSSRYLPSIDRRRESFKELSEQIIDELDVFILKRMVPSRCRYCPI